MSAVSMPTVTTTVPAVPIERDLAKKLERTAKRLAESKAQRDELIREAHAGGASLREIAALVNLSHVGVRRILNPDEPSPAVLRDRKKIEEFEQRKRS